MKKRTCFILLFWTVCMTAALSGCRSKEEAAKGTAAGDSQNADHIIVTYQTMDYSVLTDLQEVTEAINEIAAAEIGVEAEFKVVDARDAFSEYSLWIGNGKQVDLMILNNQDITDYINKRMVLPLDDYLEQYAPDICHIMEEGYHLTEGSAVDGKAYGITIVPDTVGSGGGMWIPLRYLEEAGLGYEEDHIYSMEEIGKLCAFLKDKYPDSYPLGQITSGNVSTTMGYFYGFMDTLGQDASMGYLDSDGRIKNYYESEEYEEFLNYLRDWYLAGYIYPDAAITDADISELTKNETVLSWVFTSVPGIVTKEDFGEEIVCLHTTEVYSCSQYSKPGFWTIPSTSAHVEAAMKFLNLMYQDNRISNLLNWGIEEKHYIVTDEENGLIAYPEGKTAADTGYSNPLHLYGDFRSVYSMEPAETRQARMEFSRKAMDNQVGVKGFLYSTAGMAGVIDAVQEVVEKYVPVLESGSVDLDIYYSQFLKELQYAGIEELLADRQKQFDEWNAGS